MAAAGGSCDDCFDEMLSSSLLYSMMMAQMGFFSDQLASMGPIGERKRRISGVSLDVKRHRPWHGPGKHLPATFSSLHGGISTGPPPLAT